MSIKSTIELNRKDAESKAFDLMYKQIKLSNLSDTELEDLLEALDEADDNKFTNYSIVQKV